MGASALSALGWEENEIERGVSEYRARDDMRLRAQIESGDLHALKHIHIKARDK